MNPRCRRCGRRASTDVLPRGWGAISIVASAGDGSTSPVRLYVCDRCFPMYVAAFERVHGAKLDALGGGAKLDELPRAGGRR